MSTTTTLGHLAVNDAFRFADEAIASPDHVWCYCGPQGEDAMISRGHYLYRASPWLLVERIGTACPFCGLLDGAHYAACLSMSPNVD